MHKATFLATPMGDRGPAATFAIGVIREECGFVKILTKALRRAGAPYLLA